MNLTNAQQTILAHAASRESGAILPLAKTIRLNKGAATLVLKSLLKHKLVAERPAEVNGEAWRKAKDGARFTLTATKAGIEAVGSRPHQSEPETAPPNGKVRMKKAQGARPGSKLAILIGLLSRKGGATIEEAAEATGWQHHSVRGAISGALKKKMSLGVTSVADAKRGRVYKVKAAA
ncbi:MAG TPA: DUF3489 domain-containing protein [Rhizomicrobium sp.]